MTECEKFIQEGTFDKSFFDSEIRCEFLVDGERKKLWAVELDMLLLLDKICKKHNIKYFLWYGTLLGAIRHKGMIPWDDDIDVTMFREDYDKLLSLADEFQYPYFLQTPLTDPQSGYTHAKIRNSNTCAFSKLFGYRDFNYGVWIDIFPLDVRVEEGLEERYETINKYNIQNSLYMKTPSPYKNERDIRRIEKLGTINLAENFMEVEKIATACNHVPSDHVMNMTDTAMRLYKNKFLKSDFDETDYVPFEGYMLPIPHGWERLITTLYADYMQLPPVEKRVNKHQHTDFLLDIPYQTYEKPQDVTEDPYFKYYAEYGRSKAD